MRIEKLWNETRDQVIVVTSQLLETPATQPTHTQRKRERRKKELQSDEKHFCINFKSKLGHWFSCIQ